MIKYLSVPFGLFIAPYLFRVIYGFLFDREFLPWPFERWSY